MSTRTGFPRMDWDTGFLADPKFQHLRDLLPDPIRFGYAGFCFLRLTADAWRTCQRRPVESVVRGIEPWAIETLAASGLIEDGQLTVEAYDKWVGAALASRATQAEYARRSRSQSPAVSLSEAHTVSVIASEKGSRIGRTTTVGQVGTVGPPTEPDAAAMLYQRTGSFPSGKVLSWLTDLGNIHGERRLSDLIGATEQDGRNVRDFLAFIQDTLRAQDHAAERAEKADEERRNEEKRRPVVLRPTPIVVSEEEAERLAREYMAEAKGMM